MVNPRGDENNTVPSSSSISLLRLPYHSSHYTYPWIVSQAEENNSNAISSKEREVVVAVVVLILVVVLVALCPQKQTLDRSNPE